MVNGVVKKRFYFEGIPKNSFPYQIIDTHLDNLLSIIVVFLNI